MGRSHLSRTATPLACISEESAHILCISLALEVSLCFLGSDLLCFAAFETADGHALWSASASDSSCSALQARGDTYAYFVIP